MNKSSSVAGVSPLSSGIAELVEHGEMLCLWMPFAEGTGTTVSDVSGTVDDVTVAGTTAGLWATPASGITLTTDNYIWLNELVTGLDMAKINSIYDTTGGFSHIIFAGMELSIAAAPATDISNYLLSMGRRDDVNPNTWGQLSMRIQANRMLGWHHQSREDTSAATYVNCTSALTAGAGASPYFSFITPGDTGNVVWFKNGAQTNATALAKINNEGPLANSAHGIAVFGRTVHISPYTPATLAGAGTVAPTIRNLVIGRCANTAANLTLLPKLAMHLAKQRRLPAWMSDFT